MNKKGTKVLASTALMSLVLTTALSVGPVKAAAGQVTRIGGSDRYATSAQVATQNWTTSDNVVLVSGEGYADAVSASALAKKLNAPILLTQADQLSTDAAQALSTLQAKNVYVIGGDASISQSVRDQLKGNGYNLTELGGANRYETNIAVANELVKLGVSPSSVMLVGGEGFSDALSVAPVAAAKGEILLLGNNDASSMSSVINFIKTNNSNVTVVGTSNVISDSMLAQLGSNATRIDGGTDRFDTNLKVLNAFKSDLKTDNLYVADASGDGYADALVASALAGKTDSPLVLVDTDGSTGTNNAVSYIQNNATTTTDLSVVGGTGVVSDNTVNAINQAVNPSAPVVTGDLAVSSVTATSATTFQVKFNQAPADQSKVQFNVTREGTPVTLTTTWDSTGTIATLTYSSNLPEDTYAVDVQNDGTDLGSTNVSVTAQQIAKIEVTSTTLGVSAPTTTGNTAVGGNGYATYKVLDQYGNDITTSGIAQGITWTCGVGTVTANNGLLTVTPFSGATNFLTQYTSATINGIDQSTGVTTSANLTVTQNQGTLSNITLNKLYASNDPNAIFAAGDTTDSFYIDYTATDLSGNTTNNYNLIKAGLMNDNGTITGLISSNPNAVKVQLVPDPNNSNNALIQVTPQSGYNAVADEPIVITAFTSNGKSASINLTLKKAAQLDNFTLMAPSTTVSAGDTGIIIPFTAVDQNGKTLTKYSDIAGKVTITGSFPSNDLQLIDNPDGTASLQLNVPDDAVSGNLSSQSYTVQAVTSNTGKFSSINIVVQAKAVPNTLSVTTNTAVPNMESGAVQNLDFGDNFSDLAVKDQYGRVMDMSNQDTATPGKISYYVEASAPAGSSVTVNPNANKAYNAMNIQLQATGAPGSGSTTVTYTVMQHVNGQDASTDVPVPGLTPSTQQYTVVNTTDIKDYTMDKVATLYDAAPDANYGASVNPAANSTTASSVNSSTIATASAKQSYIGSADLSKFRNEAHVYGLTSGGGKVALANSDIVSASVDNSNDFAADLGDNYDTTATVGVYAKNTLSSTKPTATGNLAVTIKSADGLIHTVTTPINSKDDTPVASTVGVKVDRADAAESGNNVYANPFYRDVTVVGNNVTMSASDFNTYVAKSASSNGIVSKYSPDGTTASNSLVYLYANDQYGTPTAPFTSWTVSAVDASGNAISGLSVDSNNVLTSTATLQTGDVVTITGVTSNGLVDSVNIRIQ
jgi:putative cell wall-binding protein